MGVTGTPAMAFLAGFLWKLASAEARRLGMSETTISRRSPSRGHTQARPPLLALDQLGRLYVGNLMAIYGASHSSLYERLRTGGVPPADGRDGRRPYWLTSTIQSHL